MRLENKNLNIALIYFFINVILNIAFFVFLVFIINYNYINKKNKNLQNEINDNNIQDSIIENKNEESISINKDINENSKIQK